MARKKTTAAVVVETGMKAEDVLSIRFWMDGSIEMIIREASFLDAREIAEVSVDSWRSTYQGILPHRFLRSLCYDKLEEIFRQRLFPGDSSDFIYVAEDENHRIIGYATGGRERTGLTRFQGELYELYIPRPYQCRGIGGKLVSVVARRFIREDIRNLLIWVLVYNPSCAFYQSLGGSIVHQKTTNFGGTKLLEIGYGWSDIRKLARITEKVGPVFLL